MKLPSRLSAAALTIAASLAMGADQSALAQHSGRQQTAAVKRSRRWRTAGSTPVSLRRLPATARLGSALLTRAANRSILNASRP